MQRNGTQESGEMFFKRYYLGCLAHASYMVADEEKKVAAVIDPQRDIEQYLQDAEANDMARIDFAFRWATSRAPTDDERPVLRKMLTDFRSHYAAKPDAATELLAVGDTIMNDAFDPIEHAAWTMLCSTLLNLDETVTQQ